MKATIRCNNGNVVELEGTPAEIADIVQGFNYYQPIVSIPSVFGYYCAHEYESPWMGLNPPPCKKCGEVQPTYGFTVCGDAELGNLTTTTVIQS